MTNVALHMEWTVIREERMARLLIHYPSLLTPSMDSMQLAMNAVLVWLDRSGADVRLRTYRNKIDTITGKAMVVCEIDLLGDIAYFEQVLATLET